MPPGSATAPTPKPSKKQDRPSPGDTPPATAALNSEGYLAKARAEERLSRLKQARQDTASLVDARLSQQLTAARRAFLRKTAGSVVDLLSDLALDDEFWAALNSAQDALNQLPSERLVDVQELLQSDLTSLLDLMGYTDPPPPPSDELAMEMQLAFHTVIMETDIETRPLLGRQVQHQMLQYVLRLRRLLHAVDAATTDRAESEALGRRLLAMLRTGARTIGPAAVAAGLTAVLFPPAAAAGGAVALAGMDAGLRAAVGQGAEIGAGALIGKALHEVRGSGNAEEVFAAAFIPWLGAVEDASRVIAYLLSQRTASAVGEIKAFIIDAMHWSYELERAIAAQPESAGDRSLSLAIRAVQQDIINLRDWADSEPNYDVLEDLELRLAHNLQLMNKRQS